MGRITESIDCALCHMPASRWALRQASDGYMYDCPACGGRYSLGKAALRRVTNDGVPPDLLQAMRQVIARGDIPRVAVIGGIWEWPPQIMGRQDADGDL